MELQPDNEPRLSLSIRSGFRRCSGISPKFARRFTKGIGKLAGNTPEDHWQKTGRLTTRMSKAVGLAGWVYRRRPSFRMTDPPRLGG
ncbi:hypothetical protein B296_00011354 [Ensete ventricosum]|uniref:Uncharacterized protein n=1 Tax=Ensete ventricosum TaxID=4639 RepID=A0A426Z6J9_ENSVE|nr:hypothetical protein B296_00011354 [Ensete ventricosum]